MTLTMEATKSVQDTDNSINTGGLGAHDNWDVNLRKAKRDGLDHCGHCAKGMVEGTGWEVRVKGEFIIPFDSAEGRIVRLGNSCVNNWKREYPEFKDTHFVKVGA